MCILNFSPFFFFFNSWYFNSWYFYNETRRGIGTGEILLISAKRLDLCCNG